MNTKMKLVQSPFKPGDRVRYAGAGAKGLAGTVTAATVYCATVRWDGQRFKAVLAHHLLRRADR